MSFVEPLSPCHDRSGFDCEEDTLNRFLKEQARQNAERHLGVTHVVVSVPQGATIQGYFTLVTREVEAATLPAAKKLPSGALGVVLLGRLAVDKRYKAQGLGQRMLLRAMAEVENVARRMGIYALVLDSLNDQARTWYLKLNFGLQPVLDDDRRLFVPIHFIRQLGLKPLGPEL